MEPVASSTTSPRSRRGPDVNAGSAANCWTVGVEKIWRSGIVASNTRLISHNSRIAISEWPPRSKKLSPMPTCVDREPAARPRRARPRRRSAARCIPAPTRSSAQATLGDRSCRPETVASRRASSRSSEPCTREAGSRARPSSSSTVTVPIATTYATSRSSRTTTTTSATAGCSPSTASISAELDPEPAELDLVIDPAEELEPAVGPSPDAIAGAIHARAGSPNGSGTKRSAVNPG